jgi:hypothetical protein
MRIFNRFFIIVGILGCFCTERALANRNQTIFIVAMGAGALSTYLSEVVLPDEENLDFFSTQGEFYYGARSTSVFSQDFGIERRLSNWLSVGLEFTIQEMWAGGYSAFGASFNPQFKWFLFGNSKFSPFLLYTAGLFYATDVFPQAGTQFTFRLLYGLGVEYKLSPAQRLRVSVAQLHQSNNNLLSPNPGYDGYGLALSYVWRWK